MRVPKIFLENVKKMLDKGTALCYNQLALKESAPYRGVEQLEARRAHNPEVVGSSPASATIKSSEIVRFQDFFLRFRGQKVRRKNTKFSAKPFDPCFDP